MRGDARAVDALRRDPAVERIEPDRVLGLERGPAPAPVQAVPRSAASTQTEPPWGLDRVDQRELPLSGTYTAPANGDGVIAYVIDDGIWRPHVDFEDRVLPGAALVGLDEPDEPSTDSHPTCSTHGSHIAGTIGGVFAGLAKQVELVPVRVFDCDGRSSTSAVILALEWVRDNHPSDGPGVVNLSFGGPESDLLDAAVDDVVAAGIAVAAAAGNENVDACSTSPARSPVAITVGSTTSTDARSGFSNIGPCVDLFAPGSSILSVDADDSSTGFTLMSGTSMATPHVAGAAALLLALEPDLEPAQVAA
ncbi:MAG: S8 family peptidase, partial [Ilumatobacteraceae bacterium]